MSSTKLNLFCLMFGAILIGSVTAQAATIHVTKLGAGNLDGTDWDNAYSSIQERWRLRVSGGRAGAYCGEKANRPTCLGGKPCSLGSIEHHLDRIGQVGRAAIVAVPTLKGPCLPRLERHESALGAGTHGAISPPSAILSGSCWRCACCVGA